MQLLEIGRQLSEAFSTSGGARKATETALLLLINALHIVEPEPGQKGLMRPLGDGTMPGEASLRLLTALSTKTDIKRSLAPNGEIRSAQEARTAASQARTTLRALAMLLQSERCALGERRAKARDELVSGYLKKAQTLRTYENLTKQRAAWRKKFTGAGVFGDPVQMRAFVQAVLLTMLGREATAMITGAAERPNIDRFRAAGARVQQRLYAQVPDALVADVLALVFDFSLHSDAQVRKTLENLAHGSPASLFAVETGELAGITLDILPPGWLSR